MHFLYIGIIYAIGSVYSITSIFVFSFFKSFLVHLSLRIRKLYTLIQWKNNKKPKNKNWLGEVVDMRKSWTETHLWICLHLSTFIGTPKLVALYPLKEFWKAICVFVHFLIDILCFYHKFKLLQMMWYTVYGEHCDLKMIPLHHSFECSQWNWNNIVDLRPLVGCPLKKYKWDL